MSIPTVAFLDAVEDVSGGNTKVPKSKFLETGPLPIVDQGREAIAGFTSDTSLSVNHETPLIVFGDHTRAVKYVDFPFAMGADGTKLLAVRTGFDPKYFFHFLRATDIPDAGYSRHFKFLKEIRVPKPPLEEQRRIAAILDHADTVRTKRRHQIAHFETLTSSIFNEMFGGRSADTQLSDSLKTSLVFTDGDWVESKDQDPTGSVRLTQLADIGDGVWLDRSDRYLTAAKATELRCTRLEEGDVLIARMPDPLGRACVYPGASQASITVVDVCVIRIDPEKHVPQWLASAINAPYSRAQILNFATGSTRVRISRKNLQKVVLPTASLTEQLEFTRRVSKVRSAVLEAVEALAAVDKLFASLQARAFRGEL